MNYCSNCGTKVTGAFCSNCGAKVEEKAEKVSVIDDLRQNTEEISPTKEVLLNVLYVLRAGISKISLKCDETKKENDKIEKNKSDLATKKEIVEKLRKENKENQKIYSEYKEIYGAETEEVADFNARVQEELNEQHQKTVEEANKKAKVRDRSLTASIIFLICSVLYFPVVVSVMNAKGLDPNDYLAAEFLFFSIFPVLCVASFIVFYRSDNSSASLEHDLELYEFKRKEFQKVTREIDKFEKNIEELESEIILLEYDDSSQQKIEKLAEDSDKIYSSLVNAFGDIVNPQDWSNIDTIIYCLETKRADNLKEALHQTDLVVRHEEIKSLMIDVGNKICKTIAACTARLSWQMDELASSQTRMVSELKEINDNVLSTAEMQKALLAKANENSKKLMEDVNKMRSYSDVMAKKTGISL